MLPFELSLSEASAGLPALFTQTPTRYVPLAGGVHESCDEEFQPESGVQLKPSKSHHLY
jgi:hypothetical protein